MTRKMVDCLKRTRNFGFCLGRIASHHISRGLDVILEGSLADRKWYSGYYHVSSMRGKMWRFMVCAFIFWLLHDYFWQDWLSVRVRVRARLRLGLRELQLWCWLAVWVRWDSGRWGVSVRCKMWGLRGMRVERWKISCRMSGLACESLRVGVGGSHLSRWEVRGGRLVLGNFWYHAFFVKNKHHMC